MTLTRMIHPDCESASNASTSEPFATAVALDAVSNVHVLQAGAGALVAAPRRFFDRPYAGAGFTLLEMLITLIILSIATMLAIPALRDYNLSGSTTAQTNGLLGNINTARSEALKLATNVRISAVGGVWSNGWVVASDRNMNGVVDGADVVISSSGPVPEGFTLNAGSDAGPGAATQLFYGPVGTLVSPNFPVRFTLIRPYPTAQNRRCVAIDLSGRAEARRGGGSC